jgi:predicted RNase H-like HicB family nuclease
VASVPALPGCHTQGETLEETEKNITEAVELYVESLVASGSARQADTAREKVVSGESDRAGFGPSLDLECARWGGPPGPRIPRTPVTPLPKEFKTLPINGLEPKRRSDRPPYPRGPPDNNDDGEAIRANWPRSGQFWPEIETEVLCFRCSYQNFGPFLAQIQADSQKYAARVTLTTPTAGWPGPGGAGSRSR